MQHVDLADPGLMKVSIIVVGKARSLGSVLTEYETRAARYWRLEVVEVSQARGRLAAQVMEKEATAIRSRLRPRFVRVALTRGGRAWSSVEMARWLERLSRGPERGVHFLIGGAFGLAEELRHECDAALSLSSFTLPHDFARLVLMEQLYRAGTILRNEPYHKGPT